MKYEIDFYFLNFYICAHWPDCPDQPTWIIWELQTKEVDIKVREMNTFSWIDVSRLINKGSYAPEDK